MSEVKEVKAPKSEKPKKEEVFIPAVATEVSREEVPVSAVVTEAVVSEEVVSEVSQEVIKETPLIVKGFSMINRSFRKNNK